MYGDFKGIESGMELGGSIILDIYVDYIHTGKLLRSISIQTSMVCPVQFGGFGQHEITGQLLADIRHNNWRACMYVITYV